MIKDVIKSKTSLKDTPTERLTANRTEAETQTVLCWGEARSAPRVSAHAGTDRRSRCRIIYNLKSWPMKVVKRPVAATCGSILTPRDAQANCLFTRDYRKPFEVPDKV
jgi:hypothetical protein